MVGIAYRLDVCGAVLLVVMAAAGVIVAYVQAEMAILRRTGDVARTWGVRFGDGIAGGLGQLNG
ncbi:MAG TPA: hypothetical protein VFY06_16515, partial [Verrucomicrobiae bacterium]|nr:hypothetical protein [Verrucomicrobiae bacterium]